jgi:hypothetical protein
LGIAREHVRVARTLETLPFVVQHFSTGELTYEKVRAIVRVATPENETMLVHMALWSTASQLETIIRETRRASELDETNEAYKNRKAQWHHDGEGVHTLTLRMTAEQRAIVPQAQALAAKHVSAETLSDDADGECDVDGLDVPPERPVGCRVILPSSYRSLMQMASC